MVQEVQWNKYSERGIIVQGEQHYTVSGRITSPAPVDSGFNVYWLGVEGNKECSYRFLKHKYNPEILSGEDVTEIHHLLFDAEWLNINDKGDFTREPDPASVFFLPEDQLESGD